MDNIKGIEELCKAETERIEGLCRKIIQTKAKKAVFRLPLENYHDEGSLLELIEKYRGYRAIKADSKEYVFELAGDTAARFLKMCIRAISLIPKHPIQQIQVENIVDCNDVVHYIGRGVQEKVHIAAKEASEPGKEGVYFMGRRTEDKQPS